MKKKLPVKKTIGDLNLRALSDESGIPYRTLFRWREEDRVPGGDVVQRLRFDHLKSSAEKLRAAQQQSAA